MRMRTTQIRCRARLASRLPPRSRRWRTTLPEEASTGDTPQRLANDASLPNLSGKCSLATIRSGVAAWSVPMAGRAVSSGSALRDQTIELGVETGDLLGEGLVTVGH